MCKGPAASCVCAGMCAGRAESGESGLQRLSGSLQRQVRISDPIPRETGSQARGLSRRVVNRLVGRLDFYSRAMTLASA